MSYNLYTQSWKKLRLLLRDASLGYYCKYSVVHYTSTSLQYWQRRSAVHSFTWNTYNYSAMEELRPEYHGDLVTDPITRKPTIYYPSWKRRLWYGVSFLAMLPLLSVGVAVMTLSLNLNGYVKDPHSPIFVPQLAKFAKPVSLHLNKS